MSNNRNWNDMTSSEDEGDSWFDDEQQVKENSNTITKEQSKLPSQSKPQQSIKTQGTSTSIQPQKPQPKESTENKRTHLKDQELLNEYINKKVDDTKIIKVVRCVNQEHKDLIKKLQHVRVKQIVEGIFILYFEEQSGLIKFIEDKIANRYRFFLQPYLKRRTQNENGRQDKRRDRNSHNNEDHKRQRRPRAQRQYEQKQPRRQRYDKKKQQDQRVKKVYIMKELFQIQSHKNVLVIKSQNFDIQKVIEQLESKKVFKDFSKLYIKTPPIALPKVSKLCAEIGEKFKFYLEKQAPVDSKDAVIELILLQKTLPLNPPAKTSKNQKYVPKQLASKEIKPLKQHRQNKPDNNQKLKKQQAVSTARKLSSNFDEYFLNLGISNLSQLIKGFDQNQYVKRLKENHNTIYEKHWNSWKIEAQQQNIQILLKLIHRLKKSTIYDVDLRPSLRNQKSVLTAEIKPKPKEQRRPKPDFSGVNSFLS